MSEESLLVLSWMTSLQRESLASCKYMDSETDSVYPLFPEAGPTEE